ARQHDANNLRWTHQTIADLRSANNGDCFDCSKPGAARDGRRRRMAALRAPAPWPWPAAVAQAYAEVRRRALAAQPASLAARLARTAGRRSGPRAGHAAASPAVPPVTPAASANPRSDRQILHADE